MLDNAVPPPPPTPWAARRLEQALDWVGSLFMPLALLIVVLLFLQWPLRDWLVAGSSKANDLAQAMFALYVAVALRHAARRDAHLVSRPDLTHAGGRWLRTLRSVGAPLAILPWALFVCWQGSPMVLRSVRGLENFPETANPGYFVVKVALVLMAALLALQSLADLWRAVHQAVASAERHTP